METVDTLKGKIKAIQDQVDVLNARPAPVPPVAVQQDLDDLGAALDTVSVGVHSIK